MHDATGEEDKGRKCEADFYVAEWHLISRTPDAAKPLLYEASVICPHDYVEFEASRIELAQLH
jgi:hypothetical protein